MVMHARKPQRISDGYFEKHQAHPYQKYNSKSERRTSDHRYTVLSSPNGNVPAHGHSHSTHGHHHYSHVPDERGYTASRNSYVQKADKERDRDYKSSRNKYTDRSPKDKRSERSNHERSESEKKIRTSGMNVSVSRTNKYDKRSAPAANVSTGGEWSEHISSSGKTYYYNSVTEVSQWEKPRQWDSRRTSSKDSTYSTRSNCDQRSRSRREQEKASKRVNRGSERYWNNSTEETPDRRPKRVVVKHDSKAGQLSQDMDISPDRSTPLSENSYTVRNAKTVVRNNSEINAVPPVVVLDNSNQPSGSLLAAALPRILPSISGGPVSNNVCPPSVNDACSGVAGPSGIGGGTPHRDPGPPTPTHSENVDPHAPPLHLTQALPRKMESLGSYSSVVGGSLQHAPPMLSPSLVNYVRTDLTGHVLGWPADILEKQANKYTEEAHQLGCLQCTRVSADLKCMRSVVRHTEIQIILQEQKIMYLRQQISRLEELKSQNSFMSED